MSTSKHESWKSFNYVCQKFGTDEMVRLRRNIYSLWDLIGYGHTSYCQISSGSAVEGLDMIGSDVDIMVLMMDVVVCTSERDAKTIDKRNHIFIMDTDSTNPCYALLRVPKNVRFHENDHDFLVHKGQDLFLSSQLFKLHQQNLISLYGVQFKIHGPCLTTENDKADIATCFRFTKDGRIQMIGLLQEIYRQGWRCFRVSDTFSSAFHTIYDPNHNSVTIHQMILPLIQYMAELFERMENSLVLLKKILHFSGAKLATNLIVFLLAKSHNLKVQRNTTAHYYNNKLQYHQFKQQQSRLFISKHAEICEIGWLFLATVFYRQKRYHIVLELVSHVLSRTVKEDIVTQYIMRIPDDIHFTQLHRRIDVMPAMLILKMLVNSVMFFEWDSSLIPDELEIEVTGTRFSLSPIILTHLLMFLSNYHLGNFMSCMRSLRSLETNAHGAYIRKKIGIVQIISFFLCLGIAYEMMGHLDGAHECFSTCVSLDKWNTTKAAFPLSKLYTKYC
ncbi:unnamed protein product [Mytilus coruscus]|uniref:Mab-21-like HhH/H2TH-like domain-containing protein n=1 Tax=Mytilus coruscus TaxID=42192 RepID=A0A6J8CB60_MYTCO|nr:unnamed protein product [Mytilus coruscus]